MSVFTLNEKSLFLYKLLDRQPSVTMTPTAFQFSESSFEDVARELTRVLDDEDMWGESAEDLEAYIAEFFPDNLVSIDRYADDTQTPHFFIEISGPDLYFALDVACDLPDEDED